MKERPILFSAPMVRAILEGRKTQTRRVVKTQPGPRAHSPWNNLSTGGDGLWRWMTGKVCFHDDTRGCPYGVPGDRLWVRETWGDGSRFYPHVRALYRADHDEDFGGTCRDDAETDRAMGRPHRPLEGCRCEFRWRPSIFMPRWASRLTLEVTGVRVERLQDISEEDAKAEGVAFSSEPFTHGWKNYGEHERAAEMVSYFASARESFESLWSSINGADSWAANPWVWAVEFKRVAQEARAA